MNEWETLLAAIGLSLDTCALMICKGALFPKLEKEKVIQICFISAVWQTAALLLGNLVSSLPFLYPARPYIKVMLCLIAVVIFLNLAIYMLTKFIRNVPIDEHRKDNFNVREICLWSWATSQDAFFSGISFGLLSTSLSLQLILVSTVTVVAVLVGLCSGYRLGFAHKSKVYLAGSIFLFCAGLDIILRYML